MRAIWSLRLVLCISIFTLPLSAAIWIVDNNPIPVGNFTTLSAAHSFAANGDTIYVYPSTSSYASIIVTKQLFFFGSGFDLDIFGGQASTTTTKINGTMDFSSGSEGSVLQGMTGAFNVHINTGNITIKRNKIVRVEINSSNCKIIQNEIIASVYWGNVIAISPNLSNILIANNKILNTNTGHAIHSHTSSSIIVVNNVIQANWIILREFSTTSIVQNNVLIGGTISANPVYLYNMSNVDQLPVGNGNLINIDMTAVFVDYTDFQIGLRLIPNSLARGAGFGGVDMGIYGGDSPYVDGGFPGIPAIYHLETEVITTPQNGLEVIFQAKSNRQ